MPQFNVGDRVTVRLTSVKWDFELEDGEDDPKLPADVEVVLIVNDDDDESEIFTRAVDKASDDYGFAINTIGNNEIIKVEKPHPKGYKE